MHKCICLQYSLDLKTKRYIIISIFQFTTERINLRYLGCGLSILAYDEN